MELDQDVGMVVATPHFYADRVSVEKFLERREKAYEVFMKEMSEKKLDTVQMRRGAEVYYFGGIGKAEEISKLCLNDTNLLLLEMPFCQWTKDMLTNIQQLLEKQNLRVMLAHVERYYAYQKKRDIWDAVMELPVYIQMNAGAFLNWKKRGTCMKVLKRDLDVVLGSDCHNTDSRRPNLEAGRQVIEKKLGQECIAGIDALGERILFGDES
jgi:protein-tyrosine phosphatase